MQTDWCTHTHTHTHILSSFLTCYTYTQRIQHSTFSPSAAQHTHAYSILSHTHTHTHTPSPQQYSCHMLVYSAQPVLCLQLTWRCWHTSWVCRRFPRCCLPSYRPGSRRRAGYDRCQRWTRSGRHVWTIAQTSGYRSVKVLIIIEASIKVLAWIQVKWSISQ